MVRTDMESSRTSLSVKRGSRRAVASGNDNLLVFALPAVRNVGHALCTVSIGSRRSGHRHVHIITINSTLSAMALVALSRGRDNTVASFVSAQFAGYAAV